MKTPSNKQRTTKKPKTSQKAKVVKSPRAKKAGSSMELTSSEIRSRAEKILKQTPKSKKVVNRLDEQKLLTELQIHQIELQMQNEELRQTQADLTRERAKYADLYNFAPVAYFTFDERDIIVDVNLMGAELLGISRKHLLNRPITPYITPESLETFIAHRKAARESGRQQICQMTLRGRDSRQVLVEAYTVALSEGNSASHQWRTVLLDITEREQAKRSLNDMRLFANAMLDAMSVHICVLDKDGNILAVNQA